MNASRNTIPDHVGKIYLIGICGTMMGALACMLKDMGFGVEGSDQAIYPPMSDYLMERDIFIHDGFNPRNLAGETDLVIIGNAIGSTNPEVERMNEMDLAYCSMPEAINRFVAADKKTILIAGTHGKTTTSSIVAWMLHASGLDPSFFVGGILKNFNSNYRLGQGAYLVIEGDEYNTAYFDKGSKFLHYDPYMTILTSIEFDHADIFKGLAEVRQAFDRLISGLSSESQLIVFDNDENIAGLSQDRTCPVISYGENMRSDWHLGDITIKPPWTIFDVLRQGKHFDTFRTRMVGKHNLYNTLSAIAVAEGLGISKAKMRTALESFEGVKRRQEVRGRKRNITVMDDFAHHPTAVRETIKALKPFYPKGRLIAVFEPRTNSSRRNVFQDIYPLSFEQADMICVRAPSLLEKIPPDERFSSEKLVADLKKTGKDAYFFSDTESIIEFLANSSRGEDLILIMSSGGFDNIHERLLAAL